MYWYFDTTEYDQTQIMWHTIRHQDPFNTVIKKCVQGISRKCSVHAKNKYPRHGSYTSICFNKDVSLNCISSVCTTCLKKVLLRKHFFNYLFYKMCGLNIAHLLCAHTSFGENYHNFK